MNGSLWRQRVTQGKIGDKSRLQCAGLNRATRWAISDDRPYRDLKFPALIVLKRRKFGSGMRSTEFRSSRSGQSFLQMPQDDMKGHLHLEAAILCAIFFA